MLFLCKDRVVSLFTKYLFGGVIQEFAVEVIKHDLESSVNRAEGFGGLFMSKVLLSKCSENALK